MENLNFIIKLKENKGKIAAIMLSITVLAMLISFLQPLKYRSTLRLLVVQENTQAGDAYTLIRSNEYLGKLLANVTYSTSFAEKVFASSPALERAYFGNTPRKLATNWTKALDVNNLSETGTIEINAYHTNRDQAEVLARAIGANLIASNGEYHGLGDQIKIKVLDEPITTNWPVKPNIIVNLCLGLLSGLAIGIAYIYFSKEEIGSESIINENFAFAPHLASQYQPVSLQVEPAVVAPAAEPVWQQIPMVQTINANSYYEQGGSVDHLLSL
ncbi:MAG: hypothetical protein WCO55_02525 [Candidatus Falkowbacteria bacterium]